jgi:DNA repair protein RadC
MRVEVCAWDRERFLVVLLGSGNTLLALDEIAVGVDVVETLSLSHVLRSVVLSNAEGFVCVHNHVAATAEPTLAERELTRRLLSLARTLGTPMLDHVIFGSDGYYSFVEAATQRSSLN